MLTVSMLVCKATLHARKSPGPECGGLANFMHLYSCFFVFFLVSYSVFAFCIAVRFLISQHSQFAGLLCLAGNPVTIKCV